MLMPIATLSMELSWRWRASYPSKRHILAVTPLPANSAKFKSVNPSF